MTDHKFSVYWIYHIHKRYNNKLNPTDTGKRVSRNDGQFYLSNVPKIKASFATILLIYVGETR